MEVELGARFPIGMMGLRILIFTTVIVGILRPLGASETPIRVRYRSAEAVYLDTGTVGGLAVGDRLEVVRKDSVIARVEVAFAAEHSASCKVLEQRVEIVAGDSVWIEGARSSVARSPESIPRAVREPEAPARSRQDSAASIRKSLDAQILRRIAGERANARTPGAAVAVVKPRALVVDGVSACLRLRAEPSLNSAAQDCLPPGSRVEAIDTAVGWTKVVSASGKEGWVAERFLKPAEESSVAKVAETGAAEIPNSDTRPSIGQAGGFRVRYRSIDSLYLDGGESDGLAIGDRLEVVREGTAIAGVQAHAVNQLASACRVLSESRRVEIDDLVRATTENLGSPAQQQWARQERATPKGPEVVTSSPELALDTVSVQPVRWRPPRPPRPPKTRLRGSLSFDRENFQDETEAGAGASFQRSEARLSLRVSDMGGLPYELRVRMRKQQTGREEPGSAFVSETEERDRFYELSLSYDPAQGRYAYRVGRMSASPFVGIGYIDGFLGQLALTSAIEVGGFLGMRADVEAFGFESSGRKYGAFTRFTSPKTDSGLPWEVVVAGIREDGEVGVSREYFTLQSRYNSSRRWSFYQRAEFDLNRGWRKEVSGSSSQLSNFAVTTTARIAKYGRFSISYDRFEQYRTEETRELPEEVFNDLLRQGFRTSLQIGSPRGINATLSAGLRTQEGDSDDTLSYGVALRHADVASRGLSLGLNYLGFSNEFGDGYVATLRASQRVRGGHQVSLPVGARLSRNIVFDELQNRSSQWARLGAWFELPRSLFANAEYEVIQGEDEAGQRASFGLGYRF